MKRKLLLTIAALLCAVGTWAGILDGWTKMETNVIANPQNYYFIILHTDNSLMLGVTKTCSTDEAGTNNSETSSNYDFISYQTASEPCSDLTKVWAIEKCTHASHTSSYTFRSLGNVDCPAWSARDDNWGPFNLRTNGDVHENGAINAAMNLAFESSYWHIQDAQQTTYFWGPWSNAAYVNNERVAGNAGGNENAKGSYNIYYMLRSTFNKKYQFFGGTDMNHTIVNRDFEYGTATGWSPDETETATLTIKNTATGSHVSAAQSGSYYCYMKNGGWAAAKQTINNLPSGTYSSTIYLCNDINFLFNNTTAESWGDKTPSGSWTAITVSDQHITSGSTELRIRGWGDNRFADDASLTYVPNNVSDDASAYTLGSPTVPLTWYPITIPENGDYILMSTAASSILYTTSSSAKPAGTEKATLDAGGTLALDGLTAGTLYVGTTTATKLALVKATGGDLTYYITNPSFETPDFTGWTNPAPSMARQNNNSFSKTGDYYAERWQATVGLSNGTLTQSISLPAGTYKLTADMQNLEQPNGDIRGSGFYLRAGETLMETGTELLTTLYFTLAAASDVTIGATLSSCSGNWVAVDNFTLTYNPTLPGSLTAVTGKMKGTVASTQTTAVEAYNATSGQTVANYNTAANAIADAQRSKAVYTLLGDALDTYNTKAANLDTDGQSSYASATSTIQTGYNDATLTDAEAYAAIATVKAAYLAAVIAQTSIGSDWTDVITNPSFEDGVGSWECTNVTGGPNHEASNPTASDGSWRAGFWNSNLSGDIDLYQSVTLPAGFYRLEFEVYNNGDNTNKWNKVQPYFGETKSEKLPYEAPTSSWRTIRFEFEVDEETTANLGAAFTPTSTGAIWEDVDNFHLTYLGNTAADAKKVSLSEEITTANDIYNNGANVGSGAFQIPTAAGSAFSTAITAAQSVYDDGSATVSDVTTAIATLKTAEETYAGATLNAPTSGVQYRIKSTAADAADWKNKYYVLKKGGNESQGGYSIRAEGSDAAYLATAWQFTSVSGNDYKLSMIDADGTTRYICTAYGGYGSGNTTQIRTTTDASKALVVKVIAATGTDGRWYLQNTEDDSYIGGQDAGFYSNSQNYDLALEAAEKASVPVTISAGKYATRIFPFKPTLPSGVTAHSCAANVGSTLTLGDVADPVANVPYILLNNSGADVDENLVGWGTAKQDTYNVGYLTGFYTAQKITAGNYVLQTQAGKQAFYKLEEDAIANQVYRAYLTVPAGVKPAAFFFDEGQADAISDVRGQMEDGRSEIFNLAGQRVNKAQKGLYIINGKKVLVK